MTKHTLLTIAIMAALPFGARAENISGAMYTAPAHENTNHPAPTTQAGAPYGRIDIDTADQEHIATTAYVKGAYNSAIAAVNKVDVDKQNQLVNLDNHPAISNMVFTDNGLNVYYDVSQGSDEVYAEMSGNIAQALSVNDIHDTLISTGTVFDIVREMGRDIGYVQGSVNTVQTSLNNKRVDIYTTWDSNATTQVELSNVQ